MSFEFIEATHKKAFSQNYSTLFLKFAQYSVIYFLLSIYFLSLFSQEKKWMQNIINIKDEYNLTGQAAYFFPMSLVAH